MRVVPEGFAEPTPQQQIQAEMLLRAAEAKEILSVTVTQVTAAEILVELGRNGLGGYVYGTMPPAEFDDKLYVGYEGFVGTVVDVVVLSYDQSRGLATVSRRQARQIKRDELLTFLEVGSVVTGVVRSIRPFGAFVDIGGLHALLPVNEITHEFVRHPADVLKKGDAFEVRVVAFERQTLKVRVSRKGLSDPWRQVDRLYPRGSIILAAVSQVRGEHLWVRPQPYQGLEVLCPAIPTQQYTEGQHFRVRVVTADGAAQKLRGRIIGLVG